MSDETKKQLRSQAWFGRQDKMGFYYRSFLKNQGTPQDRFEGKPVIGICNTWSELNPCNAHFRTIAEHVRHGVLDAGGFPLEFPVSSLGEVTMRPTAMLFRNLAAMDVEVNDESLDIDASCIMVLKHCDRRGYPGMAEVGNMPLPVKLLREGVRDMIRISDARMSGTAYGTVVLHVAPEATVGGPLALVRNGDLITLDVPARLLHLHVDDAELAARRAAWTPPPPHADRGYVKLYIDHVLQADRGADLDFLVGRSNAPVPRDNH